MAATPDMPPYWRGDFAAFISQLLAEDVPNGDITTDSLGFEPANDFSGAIIAREAGVLAGIQVAEQIFRSAAGTDLVCRQHYADGDEIAAGAVVLEITGGKGFEYRPILAAERTALNLMQRMSGIATLTRQYVKAVRGTKAKIADTRKTAPLIRKLDKYAVLVGGGTNHRFSLSDGILIKDNHIQLGMRQGLTLSDIIKRSRANAPHTCKIEVEVTSPEMAEEAVTAGADIIMLDNMDIADMGRACEIIGRRALVEASGGITLSNVSAVAAVGVDIISIGALTHSPRALDFSLEFS